MYVVAEFLFLVMVIIEGRLPKLHIMYPGESLLQSKILNDLKMPHIISGPMSCQV